ncbi:condensation domain-containing protein [Streptomyces sp. NPDC059720]|uniref:condensation domain-containing protein n=1 Tax=Streptomyces sp. NPDC059720 TaxID=3346924 RepID=UPI0036A0B20C
MTTSRFARLPQGEPIAVVVDLGRGPLPVVELHGPVGTDRVEAALDTIAARHPDAPACSADLVNRGPGRSTLRLVDEADGDRAEFPLGALADLLTHRGRGPLTTRQVAATPLQRELLAGADAGLGHQVEQASWDWYGPLDVARFTAAWRSVSARESVLRTAFDDWAEPGLVVHEEAEPEIVRLAHGGAQWASVVEADRRRGIDPRRPAPLRVTLLGGGPAPDAGAPPARVLITYHHALLDSWSVRLLVHAFYRAYLAGGRLPGGERRPDMADYAAWLAAQDTTAAEDFFRRADDGDAVSVPPLFTGTGRRTEGRSRLRLTEEETARLAHWAAVRGGSESTALQAVWAMLLYRAGRAEGPSLVRFATTATGRSILFEGVEHTPGALAGPLPRSVLVDPDATVPRLITALRDRCLDQVAYEHVTAGQVRAWSGRPHPPADTLLTFEAPPRTPAGTEAELAARGITVEPPQTLGACTAFPVTLIAHHDVAGRLVLTASHDQARLAEITDLLAHAALLLRELPRGAGPDTTVGEVLALLSGLGTAAAPAPAAPQDRGARPAVLRRPARTDAGTVGLLHAPGVSRAFYDRLAAAYPGPEELLLFEAVPGSGPRAEAAVRAVYDVLGPRLRPGGGPSLAAFSGDGVAACAVARVAAAHGHRALAVVLDAAGREPDDLSRTLASAVARRPSP